jgi:hydroxymethylglutaryl-CoA reductase
MSLHARQVAIAAGARGDLIERVAQRLVAENAVRVDRAEEILANQRIDESEREKDKKSSAANEQISK